MTHYKGIPKKRQVIMDQDGTLNPLSKVVSGNTGPKFDYLSANRPDSIEDKLIYVRATGDDKNGDGSLENPYRTLVRAFADLPSIIYNTRWIIDITDIGTETVTDKVVFPPIITNYDNKLNTSPLVYSQFYVETPVQILAVPTTIDTLGSLTTETDSVTGLKNFTDAAKEWTPDEHVGRFVVGGLSSVGVIYANTETKLFTTLSTGSPTEIVEPSATLKYGLETDSFAEGSLVVKGCLGEIYFGGIKFEHNDTNSLQTIQSSPKAPLNFSLCQFDGINLLQGTSAAIFDACYFSPDGNFSQNGVGVTMRNSYFNQVTMNVHGDGGHGLDYWLSNRFDKCSALGHGGNNESEVAYAFNSCAVVSGTGYGFEFHGGNRCSITSTTVDDCVLDGFYGEGPGLVTMTEVKGSGNGNFGLRLNGCQVRVDSDTDISGNLNDIQVGVQAHSDWATFRGGFPNSFDTTTNSGTLSRLYQV